MTSSAEKPEIDALRGETLLQAWGDTHQPNWDLETIFQPNNGQGAKKLVSEQGVLTQLEETTTPKESGPSPFAISPQTDATYTSPYAAPGNETYKSPFAAPGARDGFSGEGKFVSPYGQQIVLDPKALEAKPTESVIPDIEIATKVAEAPPVEGLDSHPTTIDILNKPITSMSRDDFAILTNNAVEAINSVDSDHAAMGGFFFRYKSEVLKAKFPANRLMIGGVASASLAGVAGFMLKSDVENFTKTNSTGQKAYYATASTLDATALAGTIGTIIPRTRAIARTAAALSFLGRAGIGLVHNTAFSEKETE